MTLLYVSLRRGELFSMMHIYDTKSRWGLSWVIWQVPVHISMLQPQIYTYSLCLSVYCCSWVLGNFRHIIQAFTRIMLTWTTCWTVSWVVCYLRGHGDHFMSLYNAPQGRPPWIILYLNKLSWPVVQYKYSYRLYFKLIHWWSKLTSYHLNLYVANCQIWHLPIMATHSIHPR